MYAVIKTGGKQYRVTEGEVLKVEKIEGTKGDTISFDSILMIADIDKFRVGTPHVDNAKVTGEIVTEIRGPKITVFKKKRRKGYRKKTGHRQTLTVVKIKEISM